MEQQDKSKKPFYKDWPFWIVLFYLLFVVIYTIAFNNSGGKNVLLPSNELGDFLAGVFAPLAFLFLYLGYKQQGEELRNSVAQQATLAKTAKQDLDESIDQFKNTYKQSVIRAQPYFHIDNLKIFLGTSDNQSIVHLSFDLRNSRELCRSSFFLYSLNNEQPHEILQGGNHDIIEDDFNTIYKTNLFISLLGSNTEIMNKTIYIHLCYTDLFDVLQTQTFKINLGQSILNEPKDFIFQWDKKSYLT